MTFAEDAVLGCILLLQAAPAGDCACARMCCGMKFPVSVQGKMPEGCGGWAALEHCLKSALQGQSVLGDAKGRYQMCGSSALEGRRCCQAVLKMWIMCTYAVVQAAFP